MLYNLYLILDLKMFMFESEFEEAAIKAYHEEPWTTDSDEGDQGIPKKKMSAIG